VYRVFLGLGSNVGERHRFLNAAAHELKRLDRTKAIWSSSVYETEPFGKHDQPKFLNAVVELETELAPPELLHHVKALEQRVGRTPSERWGPREIDVDILLYDGVVHDDENLKVPHAELEKRRFFLVPFREIAPEVVHPISGMTIEEMANACRDTGKVLKTVYKIVL
jgi:2-amino-4-hydroxy-6-hydroxymethyldihydropteridine diphosphokinase